MRGRTLTPGPSPARGRGELCRRVVGWVWLLVTRRLSQKEGAGGNRRAGWRERVSAGVRADGRADLTIGVSRVPACFDCPHRRGAGAAGARGAERHPSLFGVRRG